jgi:hypothetical protein
MVYRVHLQVVKKITSAVEGILYWKWPTLFIVVADRDPESVWPWILDGKIHIRDPG